LTNIAWWHCFAGIAGDMALASLLDAGADLEEVVAGLEDLPVTGWHLEATKTERSGLAATQLLVEVGSGSEGPERSWRAIRQIIENADGLPARARERALNVFRRLATAEGRLHGLPAEEVHFHEVGGLDALVDIVGTCLALESLDIAAVSCGPVSLGTGTVNTAHGLLPNPAPAVVELLAGFPVQGSPQSVELTTPTGAALLAGLARTSGPLPPMTIKASGYGAGSRHLEGIPNVLQVVVGEVAVGTIEGSDAAKPQDLVVLEANVDDVTGEILAHTVETLIGAGALDAWLVPVVAKKGRPGHVVSVLSEPATADQLARLLVKETGTLGFREHHVKRWAMSRHAVEVDVEGQKVRVKVGPYRLKAEYEDCARAAVTLGWPVSDVARRAEQLASCTEVRRSPGA
jgi:pyridinium-3,5-bisthiocarboxylic acid mononucleotide nickel chelatase